MNILKLLLPQIYIFFSVKSSPLLNITEPPFQLSILHLNDFHARFDETNLSGGVCKENGTCIGGFSRMYKQVMNIIQENPDTVLLNAGDNFQGTLYYIVGKWEITQQFLNYLPWDAITLGNHEFDGGIEEVVPYIQNLASPVVCANIDDSLEPSIQGTYKKSVVIERNGKKIGIIGVLFSETNTIARSGKLKFLPESESVNEEADRLVKEEGVFTNIVLSHSGYYLEQRIARNASESISIVVGGHSHSFLWTGDAPPGPDKPIGPYPTIVKSKHDRNVLVVQASYLCKYLGNLTMYFDQNGNVIDYSGAPIFLDSSKPQDDTINEALEMWKTIVDIAGGTVFGSTLTKLDRSNCRYGECTLGNFVADAFVSAYTDFAEDGAWTYASISLINSGGVRNDIEVGNITFNDLVAAQPFENTIDVGEIQGKYIKEMLEHNSVEHGRTPSKLKLWQYSGIQAEYDISKPRGQRLISAKVRCQACKIPIYEDLDVDKTYRLILPSFIAEVGDGFDMVKNNIKNVRRGEVDLHVIQRYLQNKSPVVAEQEGRITIHNNNVN